MKYWIWLIFFSNHFVFLLNCSLLSPGLDTCNVYAKINIECLFCLFHINMISLKNHDGFVNLFRWSNDSLVEAVLHNVIYINPILIPLGLKCTPRFINPSGNMQASIKCSMNMKIWKLLKNDGKTQKFC